LSPKKGDKDKSKTKKQKFFRLAHKSYPNPNQPQKDGLIYYKIVIKDKIYQFECCLSNKRGRVTSFGLLRLDLFINK